MHQKELQTTLFLKDFTTLDFAFLCPEKGIQGESFWVSAELTGHLDEQGFVMDFGKAKKTLKEVVDESLDHRCALAKNSNALQNFSAKENSLSIDFVSIHYSCPKQAIALIESDTINKNSISRFLEEKIAEKFSSTLKIKIILREEEAFTREANFRYTHGLKFHDGNCQRLIHGHRNLIEVFVNKNKSGEHERFLADLFADIHFVQKENLENRNELDLPLNQRQKENYKTAKISYTSPQGFFLAHIPASQIIILENEPSIENITAFAWTELQTRFSIAPESLEVHGYEGLHKGAEVRVGSNN